jgi:hypothetical protein
MVFPARCGPDIPIDPPVESWAWVRAWDRMRALQDEYRRLDGVDVRREVARDLRGGHGPGRVTTGLNTVHEVAY